MAFVSRADRTVDLNKKDNGNNLGPGAYLGHSDFRPKYMSVAPFSSKSIRNYHLTPSFTPGPGRYTQPGQFEALNKKLDQNGKSSNASGELGIFAFLKSQPIGFTSGAERFKESTLSKQAPPGPGSYNPATAPTKSPPRGKPKAEWQQMAMVRLPNAPSIPSHNNVFGYEETPNGELIQQQNPEKVFAGAGGDTVGPGHYEIKRDVVKRTGTNWHKSKVKRLAFGTNKPDQNPLGPGSYEVAKVVSPPQQKLRGTSCFLSTVPKSMVQEKWEGTRGKTPEESEEEDEEEIEDAAPGPGYYNPKTGAFEQRFVQSGIQQFGYTAPRFIQAKSQLSSTLGPGQYGDFRQNYKAQKKKASAPFLSSEKRAEAKKAAADIPGPGQYQAKGIKEDLTKKVWGKQGAFGSTERRFAQLTKMKTPGPGHYVAEEPPKDPIMKSTSETSVFRKPLNISKKQPELMPSVGKYEQFNFTIAEALQKKRERHASNPILANIRMNRGEVEQKRFPDEKKGEEYDKYLGPGCYDLPRAFDKNLVDARGNPLVSKDKRFKMEKKMGPGPGQYTNEEMNLWNRRTFNLLFSNE